MAKKALKQPIFAYFDSFSFGSGHTLLKNAPQA
jgi:hypothetical protein